VVRGLSFGPSIQCSRWVGLGGEVDGGADGDGGVDGVLGHNELAPLGGEEGGHGGWMRLRQKRRNMSSLVYASGMGRKRKAAASHTVLQYYLGGKHQPPILKEEVWMDELGEVTRYSLAYIDPQVHPGDNGRVLGYDDAHGRHHRHFMGRESVYAFRGYDEVLSRFEREVAKLRRKS
jgi:hypothetical protein